jgi:hypothetical protein
MYAGSLQAIDRSSKQISKKIRRQMLADILVYSIPFSYTSLLLVVLSMEKNTYRNDDEEHDEEDL